MCKQQTLVEYFKEFNYEEVIKDKTKGHPRLFFSNKDLEVIRDKVNSFLKGLWLDLEEETIKTSYLETASFYAFNI